jgi:2-polyprenyl-6-methoxyphenol hydroxylase-like FAD-dependent oxidoreductase
MALGMKRRAIIAGGSIGGLFAALFLHRAGWDVVLLERTEVELSGRGAGIVTHDLLNRLILRTGASIDALGVAVSERVIFDKAGDVVARMPFPQVVTSWDRVHSLLRAQMPNGAYRLGQAVTGYAEGADGVEVHLADGSRISGDVLVGADGFRSAIRAQMQPQVQPIYSGYVVWRALAMEQDLSPRVRAEVFDHFALYMPTGTQVVGYPIAGPGNDLRPGHRRYNFVWYVPVASDALDDMLTDASGRRHAISIPPPLVRDEVVSTGADLARALLPPQFVEILGRSERPFFTPIYDHLSPVFAAGRVALTGDAACVARPHVGMGVTKAAADAEALARHLAADVPVATALGAYDAQRQPAGRLAVDRSRALGAMIFAPPQGTDNPDGRLNPNQDEILTDTATVPPALMDAV